MKIKFQGQEFILSGTLEGGGAITTQEKLDNFERDEGTLSSFFENISYAHLYGDGVIRRFGVPIGTREDIEIIEKAQ